MKRVLLLIFFFPILGFSQVVINEFSSKGLYEYESSQTSDWIELINVSSNDLNISDYYLSDKTNNLLKWRLPNEIISPSQKILILCSGKDKSERIKNWSSIINESHQWRYFPGTSEPDSFWNSNNYIDTSWNLGYGGFGFGDNDDSTIIQGVSSFFLRHTFSVFNKDEIVSLILHSDYDDAFIAYLNGIEITRSKNIFGTPVNYNTLATDPHEAGVVNGNNYEPYFFNSLIIDSLLLNDDNVLAIQIHDIDSIPTDMSAMFYLHAGLNSDSVTYQNPSNWLQENIGLYHTNFKLSNGETVSLADSLGNIIDQKLITTNSSLISEGRSPDGIGSWCYFSTLSPGLSNDSVHCYNDISDPPIISLSSGWYSNLECLTIDIPNNSDVYFSVNGDIPDTNDFKYLDTLCFDSTTILSVRAFSHNNLMPSKVIDRTYIFNEDNFGLPVFSIITDSLNLWDWDNGIYVLGPNANPAPPNKGANFWQPWSKRSRLEFFDKNRVKQFDEEFDLEIHGGWSRAFDQKSFRLDFKSAYTGEFEYPIFNQKPDIDHYNNLNLRNGGGHNKISRIQDGLVSYVSEGTNIDIMAYEPCILYLNGKYWGLYGVREKIDEKYIESNHGIDSDSIDLINQSRTLAGSDIHFINSYHRIMNADPDSSIFIDLVKEYFDLDNYIDYFIIETYIQNMDWLRGGANNIKLWRPQVPNGKWRYVLYDTDLSFGVNFNEIPETDYIEVARNPNIESKHSDLFDHILDNSIFQCKFINRYTDLVNTIFETDSFRVLMDSLRHQIYDAMPIHIDRWNSHSSSTMWGYMVNYIANYNDQRVSFSLDNVQSQFNLSDPIILDLNVLSNTSGKIMINTITPDTYPWNGSFFTQSCPINMSAIANSGYVFSHWQSHHIIGSQIYNDSIDISLSQDDTITANFRECTIHNLSTNLNSIDNYLFPVFDIGYGPYSFQWFFNDTIITGAEDSLIYPSYLGMYSVSVTDKDECEIVSPAVLIDCSFFHQISSDLTQDIINNSLNINCNGGLPPYSYDWFYENTILDWNDPIYFPLETGNYHVIITDSNGCHSTDILFAEDCGSIIKPSLIQDTITNNLYINCLGGIEPYSYQWFIDSIAVESLDKRSLDIYTSGTYYAIIEDINGCRSFTDTISNQRLEVNIFPNPTNRLMNIQFIRLHAEKYIISVVDLHMNILHYIELPKTDHNMFYTHTFNLDIDRTGLYFIRLESSKSHIAKRFIYTE